MVHSCRCAKPPMDAPCCSRRPGGFALRLLCFAPAPLRSSAGDRQGRRSTARIAATTQWPLLGSVLYATNRLFRGRPRLCQGQLCSWDTAEIKIISQPGRRPNDTDKATRHRRLRHQPSHAEECDIRIGHGRSESACLSSVAQQALP